MQHGTGVATLRLHALLEQHYRGRSVLVTGHTGFVGSWLVSMLTAAGARVSGLALDPDPEGICDRIAAADLASDLRADVRDARGLARVVRAVEPEVVLHLAAQPLVLASYADPLGTFATNVIGTANLLDALRQAPSLRACVVVTSDKCYAGAVRPHVEDDPLGGSDPYSASKACAEIVAASYATSFLEPRGVGLATARAGNIVGGGDVAPDRVLPDCWRAAASSRAVRLRHPDAVRPWQHVLDACAGYLRLAAALLEDPGRYGGGWNFGPDPSSSATVREVVSIFATSWRRRHGSALPPPLVVPAPHGIPEREVLTLSSSKAQELIGWHCVLDLATALDWSVEIYSKLSDPATTGAGLEALVREQVQRYLDVESGAPSLERGARARCTGLSGTGLSGTGVVHGSRSGVGSAA